MPYTIARRDFVETDPSVEDRLNLLSFASYLIVRWRLIAIACVVAQRSGSRKPAHTEEIYVDGEFADRAAGRQRSSRGHGDQPGVRRIPENL